MPVIKSLSLLKVEAEAEILSSLQRQAQEVDDSQEDVQMNDPVPDRTSREEIITTLPYDTSLLTPQHWQQPSSEVYTQNGVMDTIPIPKPSVEPVSSEKPTIPDPATTFSVSTSIASQVPATTRNFPLQIVPTSEGNSDDDANHPSQHDED